MPFRVILSILIYWFQVEVISFVKTKKQDTLKIRLAEKKDLPEILDIFNQAIRSRNSCGFTEEVDFEERKNWLENHSIDQYPVYIAELADTIVGYGSLSPYRPGRNAMKKVAEVSFFLDFKYLRKGFGTALLSHMIEACPELGIETLIAILLGTNNCSIALLKKHGFEEWGRMPGIIDFGDRVCDHLYYGLTIK